MTATAALAAVPTFGTTINRALFATAMETVIQAIENRNTYPILGCVRIQSIHNAVVLTGTNLDIEIATTIPAISLSSIDVAIPAADLVKLLKKAPKATEVVIQRLPEEKVKFTFGRGSYNLDSFDVGKFPEFKFAGKSRSFDLAGATLHLAIDRTKGAISTEETRYYLNGIYVQEVGDELRFVTTDGHRMYRQTFDLPETSGSVKISHIVPRQLIGIMHKVTKGKTCPGEIEISLTESQVRFSFDDTIITGKVIDGTFPDYQRVTPQDPEFKMVLPTQEMIESIDAATLLGGLKKAVGVRFFNDRLEFFQNDHDSGSSDITMPVHLDLDERMIGFEMGWNGSYLRDMLVQADSKMVQLGIPSRVVTAGATAVADNGAPTLMQGDTNNRWVGVLMPMRV